MLLKRLPQGHTARGLASFFTHFNSRNEFPRHLIPSSKHTDPGVSRSNLPGAPLNVGLPARPHLKLHASGDGTHHPLSAGCAPQRSSQDDCHYNIFPFDRQNLISNQKAARHRTGPQSCLRASGDCQVGSHRVLWSPGSRWPAPPSSPGHQSSLWLRTSHLGEKKGSSYFLHEAQTRLFPSKNTAVFARTGQPPLLPRQAGRTFGLL